MFFQANKEYLQRSVKEHEDNIREMLASRPKWTDTILLYCTPSLKIFEPSVSNQNCQLSILAGNSQLKIQKWVWLQLLRVFSSEHAHWVWSVQFIIIFVIIFLMVGSRWTCSFTHSLLIYRCYIKVGRRSLTMGELVKRWKGCERCGVNIKNEKS